MVKKLDLDISISKLNYVNKISSLKQNIGSQLTKEEITNILKYTLTMFLIFLQIDKREINTIFLFV